ncbi:unnamed protein product [Laminaria digitata]
MSSEWAEHFQSSPSVQRYLQRMKAKLGSRWKGAIGGGKGKAGLLSGNKGRGDGGGSSGKGAGKKSGGKGKTKQQLPSKKEGSKKSRRAAAGGASAGAGAGEEQEAAKSVTAAKESLKLELAKIEAQALLYAEKQRNRQLEDAIVPS